MDIALWIVQGLLAVVFFMVGAMKIAVPKEKVKEQQGERMAWVDDLTQNQLRIIGVLEVAAAIGLILPMLLDILPVLTPLAALGLILTMIGAALLHYRRSEMPMIGGNAVLGLLALFVVVGRILIESTAVV